MVDKHPHLGNALQKEPKNCNVRSTAQRKKGPFAECTEAVAWNIRKCHQYNTFYSDNKQTFNWTQDTTAWSQQQIHVNIIAGGMDGWMTHDTTTRRGWHLKRNKYNPWEKKNIKCHFQGMHYFFNTEKIKHCADQQKSRCKHPHTKHRHTAGTLPRCGIDFTRLLQSENNAHC